ncbi:phage portal protein [uncultured Thiodictyon sp.]|nr:phage portal protein [uncultured Thiodictyon sp.]
MPGGPGNWSASWLASAGLDPTRGDNPAPSESIGVSAVYAAVSLLAGTLAGTDLQLIRKGPSGGSTRVATGSVAYCLADTQFETLESWLFDALVSGNGYLAKRRDARGAVALLEWTPTWRVAVCVADSGEVVYQVLEDGTVGEPAEQIAESDMVHLRFRTTGKHRYLGVSPLVTCAPSMGLVTHTRKAGVSVYRNASLPSVLIKHPKAFPGEAGKAVITRIKEAFIDATSKSNLGVPIVLTEGMDAQIMDVAKAVDLQLAEMSALGTREISRIYGVPPHLLGETGSINFASASESQRAFNATTLKPWAIRCADCLSHSLLSRKERVNGSRIMFDLDSLTRGAGQELSAMCSQLVNGGVVTPNESRSWLNMGPIEGGDVLRAPVNTLPVTNWTAQPTNPPIA